MAYYVYMLECSDKTFYIGSTNNLKKRIHTHNSLKSGAKYTRGRRPVALVYKETFRSKSRALKREFALKKLSRPNKLQLLAQFNKPK